MRYINKAKIRITSTIIKKVFQNLMKCFLKCENCLFLLFKHGYGFSTQMCIHFETEVRCFKMNTQIKWTGYITMWSRQQLIAKQETKCQFMSALIFWKNLSGLSSSIVNFILSFSLSFTFHWKHDIFMVSDSFSLFLCPDMRIVASTLAEPHKIITL
jgi:hypothetical protein